MEELSEFASAYPQFCDPTAVRVPAYGDLPSLEAARPFPMTAENLSSFRVDRPKDPNALPEMIKRGPEAIGFYVSFRLAPDRWGVYLKEAAVRSLREEYHRIVWRDLGKYADQNVDDIAERVEYSLVLDYVLTHAQYHFLVDRVAAGMERAAGASRYAPYQSKWYGPPKMPVPQGPEDITNLEEALANLEAFRLSINPTYGEGVAKVVEGRLDPRNVDEWKAFFIGGRFAVEMANLLSRQPPGWKDFTRFLNRKTSVGSTNYVRIQYSYNPEMLERGQTELLKRLSQDTLPADNPLKAAGDASVANVFLL